MLKNNSDILDDKYYQRKVDHFKSLPSHDGQIIFIGNSLIEGCHWDELLNKPNIVNRGISSDNTYGILNRLGFLKKSKPEKIFMMIGLNDLALGTPESEIIDNYKNIIDTIYYYSSSTKIYIHSILPIDSTAYNQVSNLQIQLLNKRIESFAKSKNVRFINLYPFFCGKNGTLNNAYTNDGLHLNGLGYQIWASHIEMYL